MHVDESRRKAVRGGASFAGLLACGIPWPAAAANGFDAHTLEGAMRSLGSAPVESADILIVAPDIAENGAVVPVSVTSRIAGTESIHILVAQNPNPLVASFDIPEGTEAFVSVRTKMAESSDVHAVVSAQGRLFHASRATKVTLGGCGG